jgi:DNA-binding MarR family transcriptional regulator
VGSQHRPLGPAADLDHIDHELPLLMIRAAKDMAQRLADDSAASSSGTGLTPVHGIAARYLQDHRDVTTVELAEHLRITKQSASEVVAALEKGRYVRRRPHPDDGRARVVELTAEGRRGVARSRSRWARLVAEWEQEVGAADLAVVRRALERYLGEEPDGG